MTQIIKKSALAFWVVTGASCAGLVLGCGGGSGASSGTSGATPSQSGSAAGSASGSGGTGSPATSGGGTSGAAGASSGAPQVDSGGSGSAPTTSADAGDSQSGGMDGGPASTGRDAAATSGGSVTFNADRVIVTGVRNTTTPPAQSVVSLHNGGQTAVQISSLAVSGANASLFQVNASLPATIMPGADMQITVEMMTSGPTLPAAPANFNDGSNLLTAELTATSSAGSSQASVYGLVLIQDNYEPTLGQILTTLGYNLNVGQAQNDWNPNTSMIATNLPGIETNSDEVAAPLFVKAGSSNVTMSVVARFSPVGVLPYGWYPSTNSATRTTVGTMSMIADAQTSNKARMVYPPLVAGSAASFDPGSGPFGLWVYSDQKTQEFGEGGNMTNGDYDFTQDALNSPAGVHRVKTYPLKDATGMAIPQSFLVAVEEAGNGDYQDYVFVLGNVNVAP